jgi:hypothetical protein
LSFARYKISSPRGRDQTLRLGLALLNHPTRDKPTEEVRVGTMRLLRRASIKKLGGRIELPDYVERGVAAINSKRVALLDHPRLILKLCGLERRVARSGRDSIDHAPGAHDDVANCVAGLYAETINKYPNYDTTYRAFQPGFVDEDLPPLQPAAQQPEPPQCNGNWWKSMPRSQPTYSADERLRGLYQSVDFAIKSGFFR